MHRLIHPTWKEPVFGWVAGLDRTRLGQAAVGVASPIVVGLALGVFLVYIRRLPPQWAGLVVLAMMAATAVLFVNDLRKVLLISLVADIFLDLDIEIGGETLDHIGGPSGFLVSLMTMAIAAGYAVWIANRRSDDKPSLYVHKDITVPALIYLFALLVSIFQAVNARLSVTDLFMEAQFFLLYFYVVNHLRNWNGVRLIFNAVAVCLLLESALILLQFFTGFEFSALGVKSWTTGSRLASAAFRPAGTLGSANAAATILAVCTSLTFAAFLADGRVANKKLALAATALGMPALVLTQSRSVGVAFVAGMLVLVLQAARKGIKTQVILLLLAAAVVAGIGFREVIVERFTTDDNGSAQSRLWYGQLAFNMIKAHPWTGIGLNNSWEVQDGYYPIELLRIEPDYRYIIHNKYLLIWVETGLLGLLAFVWLLLAACRRLVRMLVCATTPHVSIAVTGLLVALGIYMFHMAFDPFNARARLELLWLLLALIASTSQLVGEGKQP